MNEFSQKFGFLNAQSYVTHERLIDLIINADKPRFGLLREAHSQAYTWVRAWTKHEGLSVKKDGYEQRVEHPDEGPRSAVYPTKWTTFEHHICRAGIKGPLPFRPSGGGDAPGGRLPINEQETFDCSLARVIICGQESLVSECTLTQCSSST
jgi:hypothetical protein